MKKQTVQERINKERDKLAKVYQSLPDYSKKINEKLIDNAAFMAVTLEDLQSVINVKGCIEKYQNGANQYGTKKSSEVDVYNTMIKNYKSVIDTLNSLLPKNEGTKDDGFDDFVSIRED